MADNYLLVKGENGYTIKVKLKDLSDGTFAFAAETTASALPTGAATAAKQDAAKTRLDLLGTETTLEAVRGLLAGTLSTEVTGSSLPLVDSTADIGRVRTQDKELTAYVYDKIIEEIGQDNIMMLLPCWEESGSVITDMLDPRIKFDLNAGANLGQTGLLHNYVGTDSMTATLPALTQQAVTKNDVGTTDAVLTATGKLAQKIPAGYIGNLGLVRLMLKRVGTLASATFKVSVYSDSGGVPNALIAGGESDTTLCSTVDTAYRRRGVPFVGGFQRALSTVCWLVLEYDNATGVDASNYIAWAYDGSTNAYGQSRAVYDGVSWTVTAGQNYSFRAYRPEIFFDENFTLIFAILDKTNNWDAHDGAYQQIIARRDGRSDANAIYMFEKILGGYRVALGGRQTVNWYSSIMNIRELFLDNFAVVALRFSKDLATNKIQMFVNGKLYVSGDGTAGNYVGGDRSPLELLYKFHGNIGSIILTTNSLSDSAIASINNLLRTKSKMAGGS